LSFEVSLDVLNYSFEVGDLENESYEVEGKILKVMKHITEVRSCAICSYPLALGCFQTWFLVELSLYPILHYL
jgi:hypothetical protein